MMHIYPLDDLIEHNTRHPEACLCGPKLIHEGQIALHRSIGGRELTEYGWLDDEDLLDGEE